MNMPIIRVEIETLRERIGHAMMVHEKELNELVAAQLESALSEEALTRQIATEVTKAVDAVIKDMANSWALQNAIREAIEAKLEVIIGTSPGSE